MTNTDAQDELDQLQTCLESVSDLLIPETDMHVINRDKFSILMNYLLQKQAQALSQIAIKPQIS